MVIKMTALQGENMNVAKTAANLYQKFNRVQDGCELRFSHICKVSASVATTGLHPLICLVAHITFQQGLQDAAMQFFSVALL